MAVLAILFLLLPWVRLVFSPPPLLSSFSSLLSSSSRLFPVLAGAQNARGVEGVADHCVAHRKQDRSPHAFIPSLHDVRAKPVPVVVPPDHNTQHTTPHHKGHGSRVTGHRSWATDTKLAYV